eukprot:5123193-Prymnesium_polylepis.1
MDALGPRGERVSTVTRALAQQLGRESPLPRASKEGLVYGALSLTVCADTTGHRATAWKMAFSSRGQLRTALQQWTTSRGAALTKYGDIKSWDVSKV